MELETVMKTPKTLEVERISDAIYKAIITQRLKAGTRLVETRLTDVFQANRNHVRAAIEMLHQRKIVEIVPNKGAFVANPGPGEAREIFQARRVLESSLVKLAAEKATRRDLKKLETIILLEKKALEQSNRTALVRESGEFHLELARIVGNNRLYEMLELLIASSSLIAGLYEQNQDFQSTIEQQTELLEIVKVRDFNSLPAVMEKHISSIEEKLLARYQEQEEPDLAEIFA